MDEKQKAQALRAELAIKINKVPMRVQNGSIDVTRAWMANRKQAMKVLKKPGATTTELASAMAMVE